MIRLPLLALLLGPSLAAAAPALSVPCTEQALAGRSADELGRLRNEVYARRGRPFRNPELDAYFQAQDWYQADPAYTAARLTAADRACIALIRRLERSAVAERTRRAQRHGLGDVRNLEQFGRLGEAHIAALAQRGFVVVPGRNEQLFFTYEQNDYLNAPSFITTDSVLQLYHVFYDFSLRTVESQQLTRRLASMTRTLARTQERLRRSARDAAVRAAAERNLAYLAVGATLLGVKPAPLPPAGAKLVAAELALVRAHAGRAVSPLFGIKVDYSQFVPRGHYTRTAALKRFFLTMMWFGQTPFLVERPALLRQALLLRDGLAEADARKDWRAIYDVTALYVGQADELTPLDVEAVAREVYGAGAGPDAYADPARLARVAAALTARYRPRIRQVIEGATHPANVRLLGQRYVPDSQIMQELTEFPRRRFPSGLDVMAALGGRTARAILERRLRPQKQWPEHTRRLERLIADFAAVSEAQWKQNLYYGWLWVLKALLAPTAEPRAPAFMKTPAWEARCVAAALGSWAELRHDTILYAKQSVAECGGPEPPPPPEGYVEPNLAFYRRLGELIALSRAGLERHGLVSQDLAEGFARMTEITTFLRRTAEKELAGTALTRDDYEQIKIFGATLEHVTLSLSHPRASRWGDLADATDRNMALIADVHTAAPEVLEVGVGPAYEIYVLVPRRGGGRLLTRGAVFSYFEFTHPMSDRLTDEKWQRMLESGTAPPPPVWTDEFLVPQPAVSPGKPVPYGSGC